MRPVVFGEALFDHFPDGSRVLGGAPFNVAWHLSGFGADPLLISRVGADAEGRETLDRMGAWGLSTEGVGVDRQHPTGRVTVSLMDGEPSFDIEPDQAYDHIDAVGIPLPAPETALLYHGTLALRSEASLAALRTVAIALASPIICDLNLRPPWWTPALVSGVLARAAYAKLNRSELGLVDGDEGDDIEEAVRRLAAAYGLEGLVVTLGAEGAIGLFGGEATTVQAMAAPVNGDPVGAGDAFSAVTILGILRNWHPTTTLKRAAGFAGEICGIVGATTDRHDLYQRYLSMWETDRA